MHPLTQPLPETFENESTVHVLIIDDNPADTRLLERLLSSLNLFPLHTTPCINPLNATETILRSPFDIIFIDYRLGPILGTELMRDLFILDAKPDFVLLTGEGGERAAIEALHAGASYYLNKNDLTAETLELCLRNIHRRRTVERDLFESEQKFRIIFENSPDPTIILDAATGNCIQSNPATLHSLGYPQKLLMGRHFTSLFPTERKKDPSGLITNTVQQSHGIFESQTFRRLNGSTVPMDIATTLIPWGRTKAIMATLRDVSQRERHRRILTLMNTRLDTRVKRRTAELQKSENRFRTLVLNIPGIIYSRKCPCHTPNWTALYLSPAIMEILGYPPEDILNDRKISFASLIHPDDQKQLPHTHCHNQCVTAPFSTEYRMLHAEGHWIWVQDRGHIVRNENGAPTQVDGVIIDITVKHKAEEELIRSLNRERELSELKTRFVSMVSHELRTPLTSIRLSAEMLLNYKDFPKTEKTTKKLLTITDSIDHLARMMEDVLFLTKSDSGKLPFNPKPIAITPFIQEILDQIRTCWPGRTIRTTLPSETLTHGIDPNLLRHILNNLLTNALKYSNGSKPVSFTAEERNEHLRFTVIDRGIGIPEKDRLLLFESFHRASNVGATSGSGLGLSIVKRAVERHGGTITLQSQEGKGTTVTVSIPLTSTPTEHS